MSDDGIYAEALQLVRAFCSIRSAETRRAIVAKAQAAAQDQPVTPDDSVVAASFPDQGTTH